jgi:hypothetical protein
MNQESNVNQNNPEESYSLANDKFLLDLVEQGDEQLQAIIESTKQADRIADQDPENPVYRTVADAAHERLAAFVTSYGLKTEFPIAEEPTDQP